MGFLNLFVDKIVDCGGRNGPHLTVLQSVRYPNLLENPKFLTSSQIDQFLDFGGHKLYSFEQLEPLAEQSLTFANVWQLAESSK